MSYKDKEILKDVAGNPISQYFNKEAKEYEALLGQDGATRVIAYNPDGSPLDLSLVPIIDKLDQLTGTVIDEATRQANEQERVDQYELVEQKLADGDFVGPKGDPFVYDDFTPKQLDDLQGPPGSIDNLTATAIEDALGYKPQDPANDKDTTYTAGENISIVDEKISVTGQLGLTEEEVKKVKVDNAVDSDTVYGHTVEKNVPGDANFNDTKYQAGDNLTLDGTTFNAKDTTYNLSPYMKKDNDTLKTYTEKIVDTTGEIDLSLANVFKIDITADTTFNIINTVNNVSHSFTLYIDMGSTVRTLTFPATVKWADDEIPDMSESNKRYVLTFDTIDGGINWHGRSGGMFNVS